MPDLDFDDSVTEDDVYHVVGAADEEIERPDGRTEYARMLDDGRWVVAVVEDDTGLVKMVWCDARRSRRRRR